MTCNLCNVLPLRRGGLRWGLFIALLASCTTTEIRPVDIFPEDMCAYCRMAISDEAYAAEVITTDRTVYKFDDIGCMDRFVRKAEDTAVAARYVKDFESKAWLALERSTIVKTSIKTPMGSGKVAFADSLKAKKFSEYHAAPTGKIESRFTQGTH